MKKHGWQDSYDVSQIASKDIELYLWTLPETVDVINVEDDPDYRDMDIDILWVTEHDCISIEVKGDRYYGTGNYFFETVSNGSKNTLGCFLYTKADFVYYYFVEQKELHILPMPTCRDWFLANIDKFPKKATSTPVNGQKYVTFGSLVPRKDIKRKIGDIEVKPLKYLL